MNSFVLMCLMSMGLLNDQTFRFELQLYRINEQGEKQTLSNPFLMTGNFQTATMKVGQQIPMIVDQVVLNGQKKYVLEQVEVGFNIKLTPIMLTPGVVQIKVEGQFSKVNNKLANVLDQILFSTTPTTKEAEKVSIVVSPGGETQNERIHLDITTTTMKPVVANR